MSWNDLLEQLGNRQLTTPPADVYENEREMLFLFDVPGGSKEAATVVWNERDGLTVLVRGQGLPRGQLWAAEYEPADWYRRAGGARSQAWYGGQVPIRGD